MIFARAARIVTGNEDADFLGNLMADEIGERLSWVSRDFSRALIIGKAAPSLLARLKKRGISVVIASPAGPFVCDEDYLPFADTSFDLVIAIGTLDSVNDLPGALLLIRKILQPDGLFLGAFLGAGSVPRLKSAMMSADLSHGSSIGAHIHPQVDVRACGDLLQRAGFAMPVADGETLSARYASLPALVRDLRATGASNMMTSRPPFVGKAGLVAAAKNFAEQADDDGKTTETFEFVYLSGWSPSPDQPKPARRGSATTSLAQALKTKTSPPE